MKKMILILMLITICIPLFAAGPEPTAPPPSNALPEAINNSFLDKQHAIPGDHYLDLKVGMKLDTISIADVGFSSTKLNALNGTINVVQEVVMNKQVGDRFQSTGNIYMYYRLIASPQNNPVIQLSIDSPLKSSDQNITNVVDWEVSWEDQSQQDIEGNPIVNRISSVSGNGNVNSITIFPSPKERSQGGEVLESHFDSLELTFSTAEPYWMDPVSTYSGNLWLKIGGR